MTPTFRDDRGRSKRILLAGLSLFVVLSVFLLHDSFDSVWRTSNSLLEHDSIAKSPATPPVLSAEEFIDAVINATVVNNFDGSVLEQRCGAQTDWHQDIALDAIIYGGIGNVRNDVILTLRYAIDAGVSIIGPLIAKRGQDLISIDTHDEIDLSYLFDMEIFQSRIKAACPHLKFYASREAFTSLTDKPITVITSTPRNLDQTAGSVMSIRDDILSRRGPAGHLTRVIFPAPFAYLPICLDGAPFADSIGEFIPFRRDAQRLAAACIHAIATKFNLHFKPNHNIPSQAFMGAHLRTAADAAAAGFPTYDQQAPRYLKIAAEKNFLIIFLASGDSKGTTAFKAEGQLSEPPITVVTKHDLLEGGNLAEMENMNWDQQALIDYLVLLKSSYFAGVAASSFSANVAVRRRVNGKSGSCGEGAGGDAEGAAYRDEFSELVGAGHTVWAETLYP